MALDNAVTVTLDWQQKPYLPDIFPPRVRLMIDSNRLQAAYEKARTDLLAERTADRHWVGELATSALSTATAISSLAIAGRASSVSGREVDALTSHSPESDEQLIEGGLAWLLEHQNTDGGWGDTDKSYSNIATTMLVVATIHLAGRAEGLAAVLESATTYLDHQGGLAGLRRRYGVDKTFAVPILTNYALAGLVDWSQVAPLPFELACVPQPLYRWARMPVVSYAIPALVAIGQARFIHRPPRFPLTRLLRQASLGPSLRVLERMQPQSGGYLEAVPLTSFVTMSLAASGRLDHPVTQRGLQFLRDAVRRDGSWPIDTNLATWNTSLALHALAIGGEDVAGLSSLPWLLACQHRRRHPFTGAAPGGWGWSDLSGAVPDADDTAAALLALRQWVDAPSCVESDRPSIDEAGRAASVWLLGLQNGDGGWPTFCRGWGQLPFDRSGADLTAHALRALHQWRGVKPRRIDRAMRRGWQYLEKQQRGDGSWIPLWFGNQDHPQEENPVLGTARVLMAYGDLQRSTTPAAVKGSHWLESVQQADGGWNGAATGTGNTTHDPPSSVEETALAVEALLGLRAPGQRLAGSQHSGLSRGLEWLADAVLTNRYRETAPIGFYFAKLWYYERLYPLIFAVAALGRALRCASGDFRQLPRDNHP